MFKANSWIQNSIQISIKFNQAWLFIPKSKHEELHGPPRNSWPRPLPLPLPETSCCSCFKMFWGKWPKNIPKFWYVRINILNILSFFKVSKTITQKSQKLIKIHCWPPTCFFLCWACGFFHPTPNSHATPPLTRRPLGTKLPSSISRSFTDSRPGGERAWGELAERPTVWQSKP